MEKFTSMYPWRIGLALDQTHPKHIGMISRAGLFAFCYFFYCVEAAGMSPDAMSLFAVSLLLKSTGAFRTIGLLPGLYRLWARTRMPLVRAWGAGRPRNYFATGVGKSTEDAVGRILMTAEGLDDDEEAACFIADSDKS